MSLTTECCEVCGIKLFEQVDGNSGRKIFRSFGTKCVDGKELHFCMNCYDKLNKKIFAEEDNGNS